MTKLNQQINTSVRDAMLSNPGEEVLKMFIMIIINWVGAYGLIKLSAEVLRETGENDAKSQWDDTSEMGQDKVLLSRILEPMLDYPTVIKLGGPGP